LSMRQAKNLGAEPISAPAIPAGRLHSKRNDSNKNLRSCFRQRTAQPTWISYESSEYRTVERGPQPSPPRLAERSPGQASTADSRPQTVPRGGPLTTLSQAVPTAPGITDRYGRRMDPNLRIGSVRYGPAARPDYGSEGQGFESLRARDVMSQDIGMTPNPHLGSGFLFCGQFRAGVRVAGRWAGSCGRGRG